MNHETRQKWQRLFELRNAEETELDGLWFDEQREIDALAAELEKWARNADAGETLDWVCAQWQGFVHYGAKRYARFDEDVWVIDDGDTGMCWAWRKASTDPGAAMELLVAMRAKVYPRRDHWMVKVLCPETGSDRVVTRGPERYLKLAIARAAAVLAARGIPPENQ